MSRIQEHVPDLLATYFNATECDLADEEDCARVLRLAGFNAYADHWDMYKAFTKPAIELARQRRQKAMTLRTIA